MNAGPVHLTDLAGADRATFTELVGGAFEGSPWVAEAAWDERPFATVAELHSAMARVVESAPAERQLALIRAHPELRPAESVVGELTRESEAEQAAAGLGRLEHDQAARLETATAAYRDRFGFPFVVCVREHTAEGIVAAAERRLSSTAEEERRTALTEIAKIAALRLRDAVIEDGALAGVDYRIAYGKAEVPVYRHHATPLTGVPQVPESQFAGRDNTLFANEVTVEVHGDNFLPAYTRGDNSEVVATDSMKNFILRQAHDYEGATLEGYLALLGHGFLQRYEQMQEVRVSARELPFGVARVPGEEGFEPSPVLRRRERSDHSTAELRYRRDGHAAVLAGHRCGRVNMELLKTEGSAFTSFVRDEFTTLPERSDRPLYIRLDVHWRYADTVDAVGEDHARYVAGEQVRDVCAAVFHEFVSESIQQLLHEMGKRVFERYPQLRSVELAGRNMTRDPFGDAGERRVFVPPFPAFGTIELSMTRSD